MPELQTGDVVKVWLDLPHRRNLEGTAVLVKYVRNRIGRPGEQVWGVRFLTVGRMGGRPLDVPDVGRNVTLRVVMAADFERRPER